ncbi:hypothetical protein GOBAR_AA36274 [Gossypium barbadense]|uniref:Methyltransferase domain-containing protein n=1 Tax=Gossypium barbadense TaxID=3634 RepID=A0A2P5W022_GOSBA|nr:hypothetical protein GOBAR_AA36274 [Gossypium barbadense]
MALWATSCSSSEKLFLASSAATKRRMGSRRRDLVHVGMTDQAETETISIAYKEGDRERPKWADETPFSRLVEALISFKPFYSLLKLGARQYSGEEQHSMEGDDEGDSGIEHYLSPFHAYDEGNLSWLKWPKIVQSPNGLKLGLTMGQAAAEAEVATMSMTRRAIPYAPSNEEATQEMRGNWVQAIKQHHMKHSGNVTIQNIVDIGCSVGVSTRFLADEFPSAKVTGLDLSPYFLSVAQYKEKKRPPRKNPIRWIHAAGENTGLPSKSFDLVSFSYVFHECPERAIIALVNEAFRLLRPGGTLAITDQAPKSKILQELSPALFTLMKSTEPFLNEYYLTDLEERLREAGFVNMKTLLTDPRHMTMTATVPHQYV